jgi:hypothetical protein
MASKPKLLSKKRFYEVFAKIREKQTKEEFKKRLKYGKPENHPRTRPPFR